MKKKNSAFFCFLIFIFLTYLVTSGKLQKFDLASLTQIQNLIPRKFDTVLSIFSLIGTFEITTSLLLILLLIHQKLNGIIIFILYTIGSIIEILGKTFVHHINPPVRFFRYDLNFIFPSSYVQTGYSYPSGHAMRTTFLIFTAIMMLLNSKKLKKSVKLILISALAMFLFIMLISRISLGEHWTSDVIAGTVLGTALVLCIKK